MPYLIYKMVIARPLLRTINLSIQPTTCPALPSASPSPPQFVSPPSLVLPWSSSCWLWVGVQHHYSAPSYSAMTSPSCRCCASGHCCQPPPCLCTTEPPCFCLSWPFVDFRFPSFVPFLMSGLVISFSLPSFPSRFPATC